MENHGQQLAEGRASAYRQAIEAQLARQRVTEAAQKMIAADQIEAEGAKAKPRNPATIGIGGAPTRATTLPHDPAARKRHPVASGVLDYFPDAIAAVAHVSWQGNEQHNPGQPLHWARGKSTDEADTMLRHFLERGTLDQDGLRHSAKMVWRALALLQKEIESEQQLAACRGVVTSEKRFSCPQDGELNCCPGNPAQHAACAEYARHARGNE